MAAVRISCFLALCVICVGAKNITGKGYYCRDPDTGKLHGVNTTWPSTTFCGNYVCKIRKANHTNVEIQPLRQMNVVNRNNSLVITFNTSLNEKTTEAAPKTFLPQADITTEISKDSSVVPELMHETVKHLNEEKPKDGDRYLTKTEIKALTEILHSMKKSDLEALIEIYNIAQDIYKEMDKLTDENIVEETLRDFKENNNSIMGGLATKKSTSYWYEPLAVISNKHKVGDVDLSKDAELVQNVLDILPPAKPNVATEVKTKETKAKTPSALPKPKPSKPVFSKGTAHEDYFEKLPYFFPVSNFQRLSSYMNPTAQNTIHSDQKSYSNNAKPSPMYQMIPSWYKPYMIPFPTKSQAESAYIKVTEKKHLPPTPNLAYQIQNYRRNLTELENSFFNAYPWSLYPIYPPNKKPVPSQLPYVNTGYLSYLPNAVLINPELTEYKKGTEAKPTIKQPEKTMPDWQTESLSNKVLEDVRANIVMKSKLLPLRKKVKLERVGKLKKMEEIDIKRTKRETKDFDEYEAYVEKNTCSSDSEPGFFRMGNPSQPYPACCPQRIGKGS